MVIIFSEQQKAHRPAYIIRKGERASSYDVSERLDSILSAIDASGLGRIIPPDNPGISPINAVHDDGMLKFLESVYTQNYTENNTSNPVLPDYFPPPGQRKCPSNFEGQKGFYCIDLETPIDEYTWQVALASAHCAWTGAMQLLSGEDCVYSLCRPPGHHAGPDFISGYCYLNNAAIAAQVLSESGEKVAILDIDYHHGNGTQAIFYGNPGIFYASLHIDPDIAYPYFAGYADEIGMDEGKGANRNIPLPAGTSEGQYLSTLDYLLNYIDDFAPQYLVVSAGFDTYIHDPIGTFQITASGFSEIGRRVKSLEKPTLVVQEGGYCVSDLGLNAVSFLNGLSR